MTAGLLAQADDHPASLLQPLGGLARGLLASLAARGRGAPPSSKFLFVIFFFGFVIWALGLAVVLDHWRLPRGRLATVADRLLLRL
eukprot:4553059-Pyramimonas_sp.AAC.1